MRCSKIFIAGFVLLAGASMLLACEPGNTAECCGEHSYACCKKVTMLIFWHYTVCGSVRYLPDQKAIVITASIDGVEKLNFTKPVSKFRNEWRCEYLAEDHFDLCYYPYDLLQWSTTSLHSCSELWIRHYGITLYKIGNVCFFLGEEGDRNVCPQDQNTTTTSLRLN
ncbi:Hypothetical predicted protein [Cloeon dipterum]|uniref:Uncharacterized protein n=1 Tax=Cloeon dipterum TaxID=197152 RepID=A0A8S1DBF0_9INSE|nr:Hypothetical predicted protein [Cloeon dipterum]